MCLPRLGAPTAYTANAAPVVPLIELPAASLTQEVLPLAQQEIRAVVLGVLLRTAPAHVPPVFLRAEAPHDPTVVRHGYGAAAGPAELGQGVWVLQACTPVAPSRVLGAGHILVSSSDASYSTDAATSGFVHKLRAAFFPTTTTTDPTHPWSQVRLLMVRVIGAVSAPCAGGAAPVPHVSHQEPLPGHQQQTTLAVYGVAAPSHPCTPSPYTSSSTTTSSTYHPFLLVQQQAELLQLQVLPDHLLLSKLQLLEFLEVEGHLFAHDAGAVTSQALPLPGYTLAFLAVVVQEAAQVPQLTVVLLQLLVNILRGREGNKRKGKMG